MSSSRTDNDTVYTRAVRYHLKFAYHDTIVRVSWHTLGIDTHDKWPTQHS